MEMGFPPDGAEALSLSSAVDCRIGSLEKWWQFYFWCFVVDCRIGSLESKLFRLLAIRQVDCRIGSLEICPWEL